MNPVSMVFLYASEASRTEFEALEQFLTPLQNQGLIQIEGLDITRDEINRQEMADVGILACLINPAFLFFFFEEDSRNGNLDFLLREKKAVVPIIQSPNLYKTTAFADIAALPSNGKPISVWPSKDEAYLDIAVHLKNLATAIQFEQEQDQDQELDESIRLIMPTEDEFYAEVDEFEHQFKTSYDRFLSATFYWNFFVNAYGYPAAVMSKPELEARLLQREGLHMREISAEQSLEDIVSYIKELYSLELPKGQMICLVIYDHETTAQPSYEYYQELYQQKYQKFLQVIHDTKKYQFDGKLRIAFKMFNRKEICSF
ncbi:MAG: hypothetical protein KTR30_26995 [Saprospiraceae bacterium]|nr:hypothetical protein [Saprospiraceae bacterium]